MSQESEDNIVWESNGQYFWLRIDTDIRRTGMGQVRCYGEYPDMEFIDGYDVRITYPYDMKNLHQEIEYILRLETSP